MKKLLSILILLFIYLNVSAQWNRNDTTKYVWYKYQYGQRMPRTRADSVLMIPIDTAFSKDGLATRGNNLYLGNGSYWGLVGGIGGGTITINDSSTVTNVTFINNGVCFWVDTVSYCFQLDNSIDQLEFDRNTDTLSGLNQGTIKSQTKIPYTKVFVNLPHSVDTIGEDSVLLNISSGFEDGLINATVSLTDSTVFVSNVLFKRNDSILSIIGTYSFVINSADAGYYRSDKIYIGLDNLLHYLPGIQDTSITVQGEDLPEDGILVTIVNVFGNTITNIPVAIPATTNWWANKNQNGVNGQFIQINNSSLSYGSLGPFNTAIGYGTFVTNPNGNSRSTAIGAFSQNNNSTGYNNTSVGVYSLWYGVSGHDNVAIGYGSGGYANRNHTISLGTNSGYNADRYFSISDSVTHMHWSFLDSASGTAPSVIGKDGAGNWHVYQTPSGGGGGITLPQLTDSLNGRMFRWGKLGEDRTPAEDRDVSMGGHYFGLYGASYWEMLAENGDEYSGIYSGDIGAGDYGVGIYANKGPGEASNFQLNVRGLGVNIEHRISGVLIDTTKIPVRNGWLVASVNGIQPDDSTGNITISGGSGTDSTKIPLGGTQPWQAITGTLAIVEGALIQNDNVDNTNYIHLADAAISLNSTSKTDASNGFLNVGPGGVTVGSTDPVSRGIISTQDFTSNITDLDYPQKKYVDSVVTAATSGGLTAANFVFNETPSGTINSSNVTFTLANTPVAGTVEIFQNRLTMILGVDYTVSGTTVTMTVAPETGALLRTKYIKP